MREDRELLAENWPDSREKQDVTLADMIAGAAGGILGQRGRGVPVVVVRGIRYAPSEEGVQSILHPRNIGA
jgi:coenzyme F420-0:L-glutamate ligase / coenzyme F420-1:gamma-L-glutamate ligase